MNTGIQDMVNLGWKLGMVYHGYARSELLDTYNEERLPIIKQLLATTERATDFFNSESPYIHALIEHALPIALSLNRSGVKGQISSASLEGTIGVHL